MPGTKSVTVTYVLCGLFAGVGAHRFYLQDWGKAFAKPTCWLIGLWLTSNFLLFAGGGQYVLSGNNFRNCTNWAGPDTGVIAGGCWGRQTTAYVSVGLQCVCWDESAAGAAGRGRIVGVPHP